jgi:hypothetical protein
MSPSGQTIKFRAEGGGYDDRVISLILGVYAAKVYPIFDVEQAAKAERAEGKTRELTPQDKEIWDEFRREIGAKSDF